MALGGLTDWWGLGDYAGDGTRLRNYVSSRDGRWIRDPPGAHHLLTQGVGPPTTFPGNYVIPAGGHDVDAHQDCGAWPCVRDGASYAQQGYSVGLSGGLVDYGGAAWYSFAAPMTFVIFSQIDWHTWHNICCDTTWSPRIVDDFLSYGPYGVGTYAVGDRMTWGGAVWECIHGFVSDGGQTPEFYGVFCDGCDPSGGTCLAALRMPPEPCLWTEVCKQSACFGDSGFYFRAGLCGDRTESALGGDGWALLTRDLDEMLLVSGRFRIDGTYDVEIPAGPVGDFLSPCSSLEVPFATWVMHAITSDGTTVKTWYADELLAGPPAFMGTAPVAGIGTSLGGLRFGTVDENRELSGQASPWQGAIDESMLFNRELTAAELFEIWGICTYSLESAHRATASASAPGDKTSRPRSLSGTRFRAAPGGGAAASKSDGTPAVHLSPARFRSVDVG